MKVCLDDNERVPGFCKFNKSLLIDIDYLELVRMILKETTKIKIRNQNKLYGKCLN